jgi:hypothetical protein
MKKVALFFVSAVGVGIVSCSGGPGTPAEACNQAMSAICAKIYACVDTQTIQKTLGYTSQGDCLTKLEATANCANQACPQGRTYNSANASTCINDINTEACNQTGSQPPSCAPTAICQ